MRSAFLVPFFGELPPYFDVWARSCEGNHENFYWYVYNDHIESVETVNSCVTIIPYRFEEMKEDFQRVLGINIPGKHLRRVCDYRLMFYFIRRDREALDNYDFIGYTDMDMVYGQLASFMPQKMSQYSIISADDDAPCGPFTLINRSQIHLLKEWVQIKEEMERVEHKMFDESKVLVEILSKNLKPFCRAYPLNPQMSVKINSRHHYALWDKGRITIHDCWGRKCEGGFYHFSRYKNRDRFKVDPSSRALNKLGIYKLGISNPDRLWNRIKMQVFLYL